MLGASDFFLVLRFRFRLQVSKILDYYYYMEIDDNWHTRSFFFCISEVWTQGLPLETCFQSFLFYRLFFRFFWVGVPGASLKLQSCISGISDMNHHTWLICWDRILLTVTRVTLNCDPSNFHLPSIWDFSHVPLYLALLKIFYSKSLSWFRMMVTLLVSLNSWSQY
jgi:hypothetical protein